MPELHYSIFQKKNEINFKLKIITKTMKTTLIRKLEGQISSKS